MCLYPLIIKNKKYLPNKKNKGVPPDAKDQRVKYVPVKCGKCIECRKAISREWQIRLQEEIKTNKEAIFVTLTFNEEELCKLKKEISTQNGQNSTSNAENQIATTATRRFLERYRKKYKRSLKHWLISELGHQNTERIHLHGIIFKALSKEQLKTYWKYGNVWIGEYVNAKTVNYIIKYVTKIDNDHPNFQGKILCSPGIGKNYEKTFNAKQNKYKTGKTIENYKLNNGSKVALPIYYRNKIYSEEERENLWIEKLDKQIRYVMGQKINIKTYHGKKLYDKLLEQAQKQNIWLGYGKREWKKEKYEEQKKLIENFDD